MINSSQCFRFRKSEWLIIAFFTYIVGLSPFFPNRPNLRDQPLLVLAVVVAILASLARVQSTGHARLIGIIRDWLPIALTLVAFREMELFLPSHFIIHYETQWLEQDRLLLETWHLRASIEALGKFIPTYLEFCYLLVYGLPFYCVSMLYIKRRRETIDFFLSIYFVGTLGAYALFPFFPSRPPRLLFPSVDPPRITTWVREFNLYVLHKGTIHVGVFPSAHASSAFAAAWAMFFLFPQRKVIGGTLLAYAISVSIAAIYGRYHYTADVIAGFGVSLIAGLVCIAWGRYGRASSLAAP
ncbi:MAG: phosphatase PAP2 family protein [Acidobacteriaceae bacterium]|nr:phosphatase PAP2 family protein [Acidobacteriaceae bacterium]